MDWLTQGSGAKQQALLSSKTETPNKTASVQELQCCKEPFSSQVEPYSLSYCVLATGLRGHHCVSWVEEWGRDSCGVKTTTWKKSLVQKQWSCLSKHFDKMPLWNRHMCSINTNNISTTQYQFFRMPNSMTRQPVSLVECFHSPGTSLSLVQKGEQRTQQRSQALDQSSPGCDTPHHIAEVTHAESFLCDTWHKLLCYNVLHFISSLSKGNYWGMKSLVLH